MNGSMPPKPAGLDFIPKDITARASSLEIQDSITVLTVEDLPNKDRWGWWQGYRKDRRVLGFEVPGGIDPVPVMKKGPKRK